MSQQRRRFRLLAAAAGRTVWHLLPTDACRRVVEVSEAFADGVATADDLSHAYRAAADCWQHLRQYYERDPASGQLQPTTDLSPEQDRERERLRRVHRLLGQSAQPILGAMTCDVALLVSCELEVLERLRLGHTLQEKHHKRVQASRCSLIRCLFGNPFRPARFATAWGTSAALGLAEAIYAERAFERLPILADALEEAGCDNADVLAHCRSEPIHARGCWVIDGLLGRGLEWK